MYELYRRISQNHGHLWANAEKIQQVVELGDIIKNSKDINIQHEACQELSDIAGEQVKVIPVELLHCNMPIIEYGGHSYGK